MRPLATEGSSGFSRTRLRCAARSGRVGRPIGSSQDAVHDLAVDVGQAILPTLVAESEAFVVDAAKVKDRRLHVVDVDRVLRDVPAVLVGLAVHVTGLDAAAGEPPRVGPAEVVTAARLLRVTLAERGPAELAAPDHERVFEHAALLEVADERGRGPLGVDALLFELREQVVVLVPTRVHELHEAHPVLEQPAGDQAVVRVSTLVERVLAKFVCVGVTYFLTVQK